LKVRFPYNAGSWYAGTAESLRGQIEQECFLHRLGPGKVPKAREKGPRQIVGLLSPHAGFMYSGPVAAYSYHALAADGKPQTVVLIGPNHTGRGSGVSIMVEGVWRTPIADISINSKVAKAVQAASTYIDIDDEAHAYEHSIEIQLPFLQYVLGSDFELVPVCMLLQDLDVALDVGKAVGEALKGADAVVVASSDLTHYESQASAEKKDRVAIEAVKDLDEKKLLRTVEEMNISMCGVGPTASMLFSAKMLGARKATLLKYATSGDITQDLSAVVGYCSMSVTKS